ncbi:MAG: ion transporter [Chlamydiales bacterium]|nr:ion transporter [Chlamydiales bacterium]
MFDEIFKSARAVKSNPLFERLTIFVIIIAGALVGVQTFKDFAQEHYHTIHSIDLAILVYFIVEILIKILAEGKKPWRYFLSPWNIFDFCVVAVLMLPVDAEFVTAFRLVRVFRVFRLVTALPKLQLIVGALLKSIPSMGYVSLLLLILFYMYAVMATFLFGANDPLHFGSLPTSFLSLFRAVTLEDWTDLMYTQMYGCNVYGYENFMDSCVSPSAHPIGGAIFFVSFVMMGSMIILNLFIGVIMQSMNEAQAEKDQEENELLDHDSLEVKQKLRAIGLEIDNIQVSIENLYRKKKE